MQVVDWIGDRQWVQPVAAIERKFTHPIAIAFANYAESVSSSVESTSVSQCQALPKGVAAEVNGKTILIGSRSLMESEGIDATARIDQRFYPVRNSETGASALRWIDIEQQMLETQNSPCWIAVDGQVVAIVSLGDQIRDDAKETLARLKERGWSIGILSGDHPDIVREVADQLRIEHVQAGVTPEEKLAVIRKSNEQYSTTVMVGDGVNDSAALAAASVGIAVRNGAEASLAAAPVYLGSAGLGAISDLLIASQSTCYAIRRNLIVSLMYNAVGASLAMAGLLHPLLAAVLMPISSITVIGLSLKAGSIRD
jgi:Cu2+-exporting ATPase